MFVFLDSSPAPTIPEELQNIMNSDDSEDDPDFTVDSRLCSSDSEEDAELPKRRMKKSTDVYKRQTKG